MLRIWFSYYVDPVESFRDDGSSGLILKSLRLSNIFIPDNFSGPNVFKWKYIESQEKRTKEGTQYINKFADKIKSHLKIINGQKCFEIEGVALVLHEEMKVSYYECEVDISLSNYFSKAVHENSIDSWYENGEIDFVITQKVLDIIKSEREIYFADNFLNDLKQIVSENNHYKDELDFFKENDIYVPKAQQIKPFAFARKYATSKYPVFINGETGTGKEIIAKLINFYFGKDKPFVRINCAAIPDTLAESELFGTRQGAFTGAVNRDGQLVQADKGILFLDEIGELSLPIQAKLLRFSEDGQVTPVGYNPQGRIQPRQVDVKIVLATNKNVDQMVRNGQMREDFYYRLLNKFEIKLSPLRDWDKNEILDIAQTLAMKIYNKENKSFKGFSKQFEKHLLNYKWPGNIRELENYLIKASFNCNFKETIKQTDIPFPRGRIDDEEGSVSLMVNRLLEYRKTNQIKLKDLLFDIKKRCYNKIIASHTHNSVIRRQQIVEELGCNVGDHMLSDLIKKFKTHKID